MLVKVRNTGVPHKSLVLKTLVSVRYLKVCNNIVQ